MLVQYIHLNKQNACNAALYTQNKYTQFILNFYLAVSDLGEFQSIKSVVTEMIK